MDILKDLQNMIDTFVKRNEIELRGNGRDSDNVYIIPKMEFLTFLNKLDEYIYYEQSHKVIVQEPKKSKKERGQRATVVIYDDAIDESFYFPLGRS